MSDDVVLNHPTLPETQTITVKSEAVHHYQRSGWQRVGEGVGNDARAKRQSPSTPAEPVPTDPADASDKIKE